MKNYIVLYEHGITELVIKVNEWLSAGWKLTGGIHVSGSTFYQAIYKE